MFSDEDVLEGSKVAAKEQWHIPPHVVRAIMTRAVELAAARGGTMTAEDLEAWLVAIERERGSIAPIRQHISALGARNAVLEDVLTQALTVKDGLFDEVKSVTKDRDWWRACSEIERKRGDAAEERRAACLEAVQRVGQTLALGPTEMEMLKAAIEGAAP